MTTTENYDSAQPEFIAIGDLVIDAFIRLGEKSHARIIENAIPPAIKSGNKRRKTRKVDEAGHGTHELAMPFGDKIEFDSAEEVPAVGNSANAAVSAARLGVSSGLVVNIGADHDGEKSIERLESEHVSTAYVRKHDGKKTNYHYVLWFQDERTILIKHEEYEYTLPDIGTPKYIYLSSISENALSFHTVIADYLDAHPDVKLVFQPGTFQMKWGTVTLKRIYEHTELFFCNVEEAERILQIESQTKTPEFIKSLLDGLRALGPKLPIITDGPDGAYTYNKEGDVINYEQVIHLSKYPDIAPPLERTGAGDAFASTFSVAYMQGQTVADALRFGAVNSMNVCQHVGAQAGLLTREKIEEYLKDAPAGWDVNVMIG